MTKAKALYRTWYNMKRRCCDPSNRNYKDYGGRGIRVCLRWMNNYEAFAEDVGPKPSPLHELDRIDNNSDYHPNNVHWVTHAENSAYNKRRVRTDNKVGQPGVYYDKARNRYHATITIHTRRIHLGRFASKSMAIKVRKNAEQLFIGMIE